MVKPGFIFGFIDKTNICVKTIRCENAVRIKNNGFFYYYDVGSTCLKTLANFCHISKYSNIGYLNSSEELSKINLLFFVILIKILI